MKKRNKLVAFVLIMLMALTTITASAAEASQWSAAQAQEKNKSAMIGISIGVGVLTAVLVHSVVVNNKAAALYRQGETYAAQGVWDLAADAYAECARVKAKYSDVQDKLANARREAEAMLVAYGDQAKSQERYDEATEHYRRALTYMPSSTVAKAKLDALKQDTVAIHYRQGITYETQNRWNEALAEYQKAYLQDPQYQDVKDRFLRAQARVKGDIPVRAILFFVDNAGQTGLDIPLIYALQTEMQSAAAGRYMLLDAARVQDLVREQAPALSAAMDDRLAMDLGRILGATEVVTGVISSVSKAGDRVTMTVTANIIQVANGTARKATATHQFARGVALEDVPTYLREVAAKLAQDLR